MFCNIHPYISLTRICLYFFVVCINGKTPECQYQTTCPRPIPPNNTEISHVVTPRNFIDGVNGGFGVRVYREHDTVYYYCKEGFSQVHPAPIYVTCGSNGKWFPESNRINSCIPNRHFEKCKNGLFQCASSKECIAASKRCDCVRDCADQSDERDCKVRKKIITATSSGRSSAGVVTSEGYPRLYPSNLTCIYHINTLENHQIEIQFEEFDLPPKVNEKCVDFVQVIGINWKSIKSERRKIIAKRSQQFVSKRCGSNKFKVVFSNSTNISINFSLGHSPNSIGYRGFSFIWRVRSKAYVDRILVSKLFDGNIIAREVNRSNREDVYTVLIAVAISALLPLAAIMFLCIHRHRVCTRRKPCDNNTDSDEERISSNELGDINDCRKIRSNLPRNNIQPPMQLTENNLTKFNNELRNFRDIEQYQCLLHPVEYPKHGRMPSKLCMSTNGITSELLPFYPCIEDIDFTDDQYPSNQSERALCVMSYKLSHAPLVGINNGNTSTEDPLQVGGLRISDFNCNSENPPTFNRTLLQKGINFRSSADNVAKSYYRRNDNHCCRCSPQRAPQYMPHLKYVSSIKNENHFPRQHKTEFQCRNDYNHIDGSYLKSTYGASLYSPENHFLRTDPQLCVQVDAGAQELYHNNIYDDNVEFTDICLHCRLPLTQYCIENHGISKLTFQGDSSTQEEVTMKDDDIVKISGELHETHSFSTVDRNMGGSLICTH